MTLNVATSLREMAARRPNHAALVSDTETWAYERLHGAAQRFATGLAALGIARGQRVALLLPNLPEFPMAYFGAHYAACPVVPLNVMLTADEIAYHLDDSDAVALVTSEPLLEQARAAVARTSACRHLVVAGARTGSASEGVVDLAALLAASEPRTDTSPTMPDDTAVILYTSGTTGKPKGAELTHANLVLNARCTNSELLPLDENTVALCVLPLFHSFGQTVVQNAVLGVGGTIVLMPRFEPEAALALMARHRVALFAGVPTMYVALLNHPAAERHDLSSLRFCVSGGAPMPVEVMRAFDARYGVNILEGYGLSETSPVATFNTLDRPKKPGSVGLPIAGCEVRLVDAEGGVVDAAHVDGEIEIKGHNVMKGYLKRPEATAAAIKEGWFASGDIGRRDEDGYYFIVDRKKDMVIRGGYNVYPREIEEVLYAHPAVAEAAVIGVAHASLGEEVKAFVVLREGHAARGEDIVDYCKRRLAAYKYPRVVEFVPALPKGPTGKILKRELRG